MWGNESGVWDSGSEDNYFINIFLINVLLCLILHRVFFLCKRHNKNSSLGITKTNKLSKLSYTVK